MDGHDVASAHNVTDEHEAVLTLSQQNTFTESPDQQTHQPATISHTYALHFPTLSPDGSIEDISDVPVDRHAPTPPAALSTLGAKARMASTDDLSDSTSSLTDSQYDMVDDVSELSTDDHDTASIASTEHGSDDGQITPAETNSMVDVEEEIGEAMGEARILPPPEASIASNTKMTHTKSSQSISESQNARAWAEDVVDSYLTDDLETPRQSILPAGFSRLDGQASPAGTSTLNNITAEHPLRILFIAERSIPETEKLEVCAKIATSLAGSHDQSRCSISKLPAIPSGISPSDVTIVKHGDTELHVRFCVGAATRHTSSSFESTFALQILDSDGQHSSVYIVRGHDKPELYDSDLAIMYLHAKPKTGWPIAAHEAMRTLGTPELTIARYIKRDYQTSPLRDGGSAVKADRFLQLPNEDLTTMLEEALAVGKWKHVQNKAAQAPPPESVPQVVPQSIPQSEQPTKASLFTPSATRMMLTVVTMLLALMLATYFSPSNSPIAEVALRREALGMALSNIGYSTEATKTINVEHLLPQPSATTTNILGAKVLSPPSTVQYSCVQNHVIFSFPKRSAYGYYASPKTIEASRSRTVLPLNQTKLIEGVYDFAVNPTDAHGVVHLQVLTKHPSLNSTAVCNFGSKMLQRKTYEKASTDLSKSVNQEMGLARDRVKSLRDKMQIEFSAGTAATMNVTNQLAVYVARDVQVFTRSVVSVFGKAAQAGSKSVATLRKDVVLATKDLVKYGRGVKKSFSTTAQRAKALMPSKKTVASPLAASRERALAFKQKLFGQKKAANRTSMTKELSTYVRNLMKPLERKNNSKTRFQAAMYCLKAKHFNACRKEQKERIVAAGSKMTSSLSTVPDQPLAPKVKAKSETKAKVEEKTGKKPEGKAKKQLKTGV